MQTDAHLGGAHLNPYVDHCTEQIMLIMEVKPFPALIETREKSKNSPSVQEQGREKKQRNVQDLGPEWLEGFICNR